MIAFRRLAAALSTYRRLPGYSRGREDVSSEVSSEGGFTLVELMASLTILAIGIVSLMSTLVVAARAASAHRARLNAIFAANMAFEEIRGRPYPEIRLCDCDPDFALRPQTAATTDTVVTTDSAAPYVPVRSDPIVLAGVRFEILKNIAWVPYTDPETGVYYQRSFKLVVLNVSWNDHVGRHTIQVEEYVYPGAQGETRGVESCELATVPPQQPVSATAEVFDPNTALIMVEWRDRARTECYYEVAYLQSETPVSDCSATFPFQWVLYGQSPRDSDAISFPGVFGTGYCFRVRAVNGASPNGDDPSAGWVYTSWISTPPPPPDCVIAAPVVRSPATNVSNPNQVKLLGNNTNQDDIAFAISVSGTCSRVWVEVPTSAGTEIVDLAPSGGQWFAVQPARWQSFNVGWQSIVFRAAGQGDPVPAIQRVCFYKNKLC